VPRSNGRNGRIRVSVPMSEKQQRHGIGVNIRNQTQSIELKFARYTDQANKKVRAEDLSQTVGRKPKLREFMYRRTFYLVVAT